MSARSTVRGRHRERPRRHAPAHNSVGLVILWSCITQNLMWAFNIAYEREEGRGFIRRRLTELVDRDLVF